MKKNRKINIAFAGTPEIAFDIFEELSKKDFQISFILTQTDKKAGRGAQLKSSKFLEKKDMYNILQPENLNDDDFKKIILNQNIDLLIVVAYGKILPSWLLEYPKYGCLNVHFSLLPKWRGAAPMQRAIANGDKSFGVSFMKIEEKLDAGGIYKTFSTNNHGQDIYALEEELVEITNMDLSNTIIEICSEKIIPETQEDEKATYADKVEKEEGLIKKLFVTGCLSERYKEDLISDIPEVDGFYGTGDLPELLKNFEVGAFTLIQLGFLGIGFDLFFTFSGCRGPLICVK